LRILAAVVALRLDMAQPAAGKRAPLICIKAPAPYAALHGYD
jgi:hypothetical protein